MSSEIRIPTILGLGVLLTGLIAGIFLVTQNQFLNLRTQASPTVEPKNITLANLSDTSVSIYWQTDQPSSGFIKAGIDSSLGLTSKDDRDMAAPQDHIFHFVTLKNLNPDTTYFYKIVSGATTYPAKDALSFKTSSPQEISNLKPLIGTVLNINKQPVSEAIVTLEIPGAYNLAAVTKISGNFILPLGKILTSDLSGTFTIPESGLSTTLTVFNNEKSSRATIQLPQVNETLPSIILGQDADLTVQNISPTPSNSIYDLNSDGVINSLDIATLRKNLGKNSKLKQADFNLDGIVDQKDVDILTKFIPNTSPK